MLPIDTASKKLRTSISCLIQSQINFSFDWRFFASSQTQSNLRLVFNLPIVQFSFAWKDSIMFPSLGGLERSCERAGCRGRRAVTIFQGNKVHSIVCSRCFISHWHWLEFWWGHNINASNSFWGMRPPQYGHVHWTRSIQWTIRKTSERHLCTVVTQNQLRPSPEHNIIFALGLGN